MTDRLQGVRDRSATWLTISNAHLVRNIEAAGGGAVARTQEALVEGEERRRPVRVGKSAAVLLSLLSSTRSRLVLISLLHSWTHLGFL